MKKYPLLLTPVSKEIIWGGDRLKKEYGKTAPFDKIAESWELSVREKEMNIIANGEYKGISLGDYISENKTDALGTLSEKYDRFPLLIKFIDAMDRLSIQVHPDDEYSLANEGELGKTEMWYIVDAIPSSKLVYGLTEGTTPEDLRKAVKSGKTEEKMNFVEVHPGDVYFIPSGQVHAIGSGILIAEIQQNSNVTYRVYDYGRLGADGKPREIHTEKALDVIKVRTEEEIDKIRFSRPAEILGGELLCSCDYFKVAKYSASENNPAVLDVGAESFASFTVLSASDAYADHQSTRFPLKKGETYFIPASSGKVEIKGTAEIIVSEIQ